MTHAYECWAPRNGGSCPEHCSCPCHPQNNMKFRVVVCDFNGNHMPITVMATQPGTAKWFAENIMEQQFHTVVEVAEIWDEADISIGEPGETYYPDNHTDCTMMQGMDIVVA